MLRADELLAGLQEEPLAAGLALREVGAGTELGLDIDGRWRGLIRVEGRVVEVRAGRAWVALRARSAGAAVALLRGEWSHWREPLALREHQLRFPELRRAATSPPDALHVSLGSVEARRLPGRVGEPLRDPLTCGPCPAEPDDLAAWLDQRSEWWGAEAKGRPKTQRQRELVANAAFAAQVVDNASPLVVWAGRSAGEQLMLCLVAHHRPASLPLLHARPPPYPGDEVRVIPSVSEEWARAAILREPSVEERRALAEVWRAWCRPEPTRFRRLAAQGSRDGLLALIGSFPHRRTGLTAHEERAIDRLIAHPGEAAAGALGQIVAAPTADTVGDLVLVRWLEELAELGVLSATADENPWRRVWSVTELGREVRSGRVCRTDLAPMNRWVGGVHLRAGRHWWRDGDALVGERGQP